MYFLQLLQFTFMLHILYTTIFIHHHLTINVHIIWISKQQIFLKSFYMYFYDQLKFFVGGNARPYAGWLRSSCYFSESGDPIPMVGHMLRLPRSGGEADLDNERGRRSMAVCSKSGSEGLRRWPNHNRTVCSRSEKRAK